MKETGATANIDSALMHVSPASAELLTMHAIDSKASVRETLSALNRLSGDSMTLFAIGEDGILKGTITDGDIRRALIAGAALEDSAESVAHRDFMACSTHDNPGMAVAKARRLRIDLLPVVADGFVTDIIDLRKIKTILPIDAVLMAGGRGERLRPLTLDTPKPLLKVGGKAIIDYNVGELEACGVENIYVTVNYLAEKIESHFHGREGRACVECVREPKRLGTMGSLALIDTLRHDDILVMNSDLLTNLDFEQMYLHHLKNGADLTVAAVPYTVSVPFAIMQLDGVRVTGLSEKPTFNYFANAGVYILKRSLLAMIERGEYLDAPDFMEKLIGEGLNVSCFPVKGTWIDIGSPDDYRYANELMNTRGKL